jgi:hypothetical protein
MTRTPLFYVALYVHTIAGIAAILAPIVALLATHGGDRHRRAGWWFVQSVAVLFVTTAVMASIRYTLFLFVIGYVAWYAAHQAWLVAARPGDRVYLDSRLASRVQHDLAIALGLTLVAASLATPIWPEWRVTPGGLGLGVAFVYGSVLAAFGWAARVGRLRRLPVPTRHVLYVGLAAAATYSEFFADVTNQFLHASGVWISSWILPAIVVTWLVARRLGGPALRAHAAALVSPAGSAYQ